jgi:hypothetical protein
MMGLNVTAPGDDKNAVSGVVQPTTAIFSLGCASHLKGCSILASRGTALAFTLHTAKRWVACRRAVGNNHQGRAIGTERSVIQSPCRTSERHMLQGALQTVVPCTVCRHATPRPLQDKQVSCDCRGVVCFMPLLASACGAGVSCPNKVPASELTFCM